MAGANQPPRLLLTERARQPLRELRRSHMRCGRYRQLPFLNEPITEDLHCCQPASRRRGRILEVEQFLNEPLHIGPRDVSHAQ
jgi:hypothetical protein